MAYSASCVWEVRTTGNSANGGGFRWGSGGTDYSQQDTAQVSYTDLVIGTTTTQLTSAAHPFTSAHVGNFINISGGSGFTTGFYEVMSVASGVATMNTSVGTASSTGGVGKLGGAMSSLGDISGQISPANVCWVKAGSYTVSATQTFSGQGNANGASAIVYRIKGYNTTRGDISSVNGLTRPQLTFAAGVAANSTVLNFASWGWVVENLSIDCNFVSGSAGIRSSFYFTAINCKVVNAQFGLYLSTSCNCYQCEVTACISGGLAINANGAVVGCWIHDNPCVGIVMSNNGVALYNLVSNLSGSTSDGIQFSGVSPIGMQIMNNTIYKCGRHGIYRTSGPAGPDVIWNNVLGENGGYGIVFGGSAGLPALLNNDGNFFYLNTSGNRSNGDDTSVNPQNGSGPYTNQYDVLLTADPFTSKSTNDFTLNNTAGGGAAVKQVGRPRAWPGSSLSGYPNGGAIQPAQAAGGGGAAYYAF